MRINKYLAECGLASRRKSEQLILDKRVHINGRIVTNLATEVTDNDIVTVDKERVSRIESHVYLMMNKPKGYVCTTNDEHGRATVLELIKDKKYADKRLFPVGRLDYDTEGLLIITTDGDLANRLTHPRNEIDKTYVVKVEGTVTEAEMDILRRGVELDGVRTKKCKVKLLELVELEDDKVLSRLEIVISEGRNRQVRRMVESIGRQVEFLKRTKVGSLALGGVSRGMYRELKEKEIMLLKNY